LAELALIVVLLVAALAWVLIYFFGIERWLQRHIGNVFGVTIGKTRLMERRQDAHTQFSVSGWKITAPQSAGACSSSSSGSWVAWFDSWSSAYRLRHC
jgi:hypothetical protein